MARSLKLFVKDGFGPSASTGISGIGLLSMFHPPAMLRLANERNMGQYIKNDDMQEAALVSVTSQDGVMRRRYRTILVQVLPDGQIVMPPGS